MKEKLKYISYNLRSHRAKNGYTQDKVAELLNVSRTTYNDYEVNPQKVKVETYMKIAELFHCQLSDFFVENDVALSNEE